MNMLVTLAAVSIVHSIAIAALLYESRNQRRFNDGIADLFRKLVRTLNTLHTHATSTSDAIDATPQERTTMNHRKLEQEQVIEVVSPARLEREARESGTLMPSDVAAPNVEYCVHVTVHRVGDDLNSTASRVFGPANIDECTPTASVMTRLIANLESGIASGVDAANGRKGGHDAAATN